VENFPVVAFGLQRGKPLNPILQVGSCDQRLFTDLADWNFAARDQLIEFRAPDCRHLTALGNREEQLIHVGPRLRWAGTVPATTPMSVIGHPNVASSKFRKKQSL
jgi:hypothetical protein